MMVVWAAGEVCRLHVLGRTYTYMWKEVGGAERGILPRTGSQAAFLPGGGFSSTSGQLLAPPLLCLPALPSLLGCLPLVSPSPIPLLLGNKQ